MKDFMQSLQDYYQRGTKRPDKRPEHWLMEQAQRRGWGYAPPNNSPAEDNREDDREDDRYEYHRNNLKRWDKHRRHWQTRNRLTDKWIDD